MVIIIRTIVFEFQQGFNDKVTEEFEFEVTATDEEINKEYELWLWELIGDRCTWYDK